MSLGVWVRWVAGVGGFEVYVWRGEKGIIPRIGFEVG